MAFNKTLWLAQFAKAGKDTSQYDKILQNCAVDYSKHVTGSEEKITVPKYVANAAKEGDLSDEDFTEGTKTSFDIPLDESLGGKKFSIGFLSKPFEQRNTPANYYAEHAKSKMPAFKKAYANAILVSIINGTKSSNRINLADDTENKLSKADFINAGKLLDDADIEEENRYAVIPSGKRADLYSIAEFISSDKMGKVVIPTGAIGKILNFWIIPAATPKVNSSGEIDATEGNNTKECVLFGHKYGQGYAIDPYTNITETPDANTGNTKESAQKRGGTATAYDTHTVVVYENTIV